MQPLYIIILGSLIASCCALLGCFLLLRKMTMLGDAIAHAVLPGIVISYIVSGERDHTAMLIGATVAGLLTTFSIEFLSKKIKLQQDAATGVMFTGFFAIGVILISLFANKIDLDQDCVLYGEIGYLGLYNDAFIPIEIWRMLIILGLIITFIVLGYRQLLMTTFDLAFASSVGIMGALWQYLLMGFVSLTTVASFESVGSILVVSFLIIPPAAAYLITHSLQRMLIYACLIGIIGAISGYYLAVFLDSAIAAAMSVACGVELILIFIYVKLWKERVLSKAVY
ncbi:MAG: metal ABC transporter permease [Cytophagales bacterium]|nr:MAG: metal ABC transporter permease [Cytophagales bacterium]